MEGEANQENGGIPERIEPEEIELPDDTVDIFDKIAEIVESEEIPDERKVKLLQTTFIRHFRGPVPPPWIVAGYDKVVPGGAQWLLEHAKEEQQHRHSMDKSHVAYYTRGQTFAFVLAIIGLVGGIGLTALGATFQGLAVFMGSLAALIGAFVYTQREDRKKEGKEMEALKEILDKLSDEDSPI